MNLHQQPPCPKPVDPQKTRPLETTQVDERRSVERLRRMDPMPASCAQVHCARELAADRTVSRQIEFVAFVAHELRNPLGPIRTAAAILTRANGKELEWAQGVIERQVSHLSRMVEDLLDMARGHMGKLRLAIDTVELQDCIELAAAACHRAMDSRHQRLEIRGLGQGCPMQADAVRLTQILSNLLDNASKYSADGQVIQLDVNQLSRTASGERLKEAAAEMLRAWPAQAAAAVHAGDPSAFFLVEMYTSVPCDLDAPVNVTLLGDAIHAMTPSLGRGANVAMRDGALLGRRLNSVAAGKMSLDTALAAYERGMLKYGFDVVREAALVGQQRMAQDPLPTALK